MIPKTIEEKDELFKKTIKVMVFSYGIEDLDKIENEWEA